VLMYWPFFGLLFISAHLALIAALWFADRGASLSGPLLSLIGTLLFAIASVSSSSLSVATDGGLETINEPVLGIWAFAGALIAMIVTLALTLDWLGIVGGHTHGY
ncbi:hypothetical protein, partial [Microbispora corallina]|uniref:hypothetical protein n=1 Tax=Microbispora corallina TaxID=83302 RepID=UPI0031D18364